MEGDLRRLVPWVVDGVAEGCVAVEDTGLEELLEAVGEDFGAACEVYHVVDIVVGIEGVRPRHVLIQRICRNFSQIFHRGSLGDNSPPQ